jgi:CSLREA domain-containing protein
MRFFTPILAVFFLSVAGHGATFVVTKANDTNDGVCNSDCSLREAIGAANASGADDSISFDANFFSMPRFIVLGGTALQVEGGGALVINGLPTITLSANSNSRVFTINSGAAATIIGLEITAGSADFGGAIHVKAGANLALERCTVRNNMALQGAGIFNEGQFSASQVVINNNNSTGPSGGAGIANRGTAQFVNTTVTQNTAFGGNGGGISIIDGGSLAVENVTVASNTARDGGGATVVQGSLTSRTSIFGDNTASAGTAHDVLGVINSGGHNLIENITGTVVAGSALGDIFNKDPRLLPLRRNGGQTSSVGMLCTSPAVDAGDPNSFPAIDQRGTPRAQDGDLNGNAMPDIGAYETQMTLFKVTKTADTNDGICDSDCSLREAVSRLNAAATPDNAIIFAPEVFSNPITLTLTTGTLQFTSDKNIFVKGTGADVLTISGNRQSPVFLFINTGSLPFYGAVTDLTLTEAVADTAVAVGASSLFEFKRLTLRDNAAGAVRAGGRIFMSDSKILNNFTPGQGGGISASGPFWLIENCLIAGNTARNDGGGIWGGNLTIRDSVIENNKSIGTGTGYGQKGGGVYLGGANLLENVIISNNDTLGGSGGGLQIQGGRTSIKNSLISNNRAQTGGGALIESFSEVDLTNVTISQNQASRDGGGVWCISSPPSGYFSANHTTIAFNSAGQAGGGIRVFNSGLVRLRNSIVANNLAPSSGDVDGSVTSFGHNLIEQTSGTTILGTTTGNILGEDPKLAPQLMLNGGLTANHRLLDGSPAIDRAGAPTPIITTDQRGRLRPHDFPQVSNADEGNGSDIGAIERHPDDRSGSPWFDYDGDGVTDFSVFRPSTGAWYLQRSTAGFLGLQFGANGDKLAPADYDGDGKTDIAVYRPGDGRWYILNSATGTVSYPVFGVAEDVPAPGDYDGDGKADLTVFRPSQGTWYRQNSSNGTFFGFQFGANGDVPTVGDFDGDGKNDLGIWRPSNGDWYNIRSSNGSVFGERFGQTGDKIAPADYDGDGKTDIAIYRPATGLWVVRNSATSTYSYAVFGSSADIPISGDYDGDGKADIGVWRPSDGTWYVQRSSNGSFLVFPWGQNGDRPTPSAYGN